MTKRTKRIKKLGIVSGDTQLHRRTAAYFKYSRTDRIAGTLRRWGISGAEPSRLPRSAYVVVQQGRLVGIIEVDRCPLVGLRRCEPCMGCDLFGLTSEIKE